MASLGQGLRRERGREAINRRESYLRQSKGHQRTHHYHEVQDVPQVSEVGPVLQNQALVDHLQKK